MVTGHRTRREGRYYEDFQVGEAYEHPYGRTITEADNVWFSSLTLNASPLHIDYAYAAQTEFGRPLVNSTFTLALVVGLSVGDISENAVANLGWDKVRLPAPVFAGDTIYAESEVLEKRESASRPHAGIVRFHTRGYNQDGRVVIEFERTVMVYKRGASPKATRPRPRAEA